ncbi:MAG: 3-methyladenine DNA glycosylase Tag [Pseudoalteromonas tetraodonis]|jgi:3-methyladenine DNA glycosylase Tag
MTKFQALWDRAAQRKGGKEALALLMPATLSQTEFLSQTDDRWLSMMTRCVFRAGFVWRVIEHKWDGFEEAFSAFNIAGMSHLDDERLDRFAKDTRIVRNPQKIKSVRDNAIFVADIAEEHGSFSQFVANWPSEDIVGLWMVLKKRGSRLGGNSGPMVLRSMGKDTPILTYDVVAALVNHAVIDTDKVSSQRAQRLIQDAFNQWQQETGLPLAHLSRIAAMAVGD